MNDARGFQEFLKKCWDNVCECLYCTVLFHCFLQTIPKVMKPGPQHLKVPLKSVFHQTGHPKKDTHCTVAPCCYKCAQKISRQGAISLLFRTDNIFKRMWPDTLIP